jgi:hypothetical protein
VQEFERAGGHFPELMRISDEALPHPDPALGRLPVETR